MTMLWATVSYLIDKISSARTTDTERGALSLEWIVIAVALVGAAGIAAVFFGDSISREVAKLP